MKSVPLPLGRRVRLSDAQSLADYAPKGVAFALALSPSGDTLSQVYSNDL